VLYIIGYGRSGSTLLDIMLGNHPEVFGAGEATWIFKHFRQNIECSCGTSARSCPVWAGVFKRVGSDPKTAARLTLAGDRAIGIPNTEEYRKTWRTMFDALGRETGARWIVDSSKISRLQFNRLHMLGTLLPDPPLVVHLIRDPRAVMWSVRRGSNRRLAAGDTSFPRGREIRGVASWILANSMAELVRMSSGFPWRVLRYEDLVARPTSVLSALLKWMQLDPDPVIRRLTDGRGFDVGHSLSGNRMRSETRTVQIRPDSEWEEKLPAMTRLLALPAVPLMRRYGYVGVGKATRVST
jgi:hypothetical protein